MNDTIALNWWHLIFLVSVAQGLMISVLIYFKYDNYQSKYLSLISFLFSIMIIYYLIYWTGNAPKLPRVVNTIQGFTFFFMPLFYGLFSGVPLKDFIRSKRLLHFVSFGVFALLYLAPGYFFWSALFLNVHLVVYVVLCYAEYRKDPNPSFRWILLALAGYVAAYTVYTALVFMRLLTASQDYFLSLIMCGFIYALMIKAFFSEKFMESIKRTRLLSESMTHALIAKVEDYFEEKKAYLTGDLKISDLSKELGFSSHQISEAINSKYNGFNDFINLYRVNHSIDILKHSNDKILSVAFQSGFNNKVSFYKAFKKYTGETPSEWRIKRTLKTPDLVKIGKN